MLAALRLSNRAWVVKLPPSARPTAFFTNCEVTPFITAENIICWPFSDALVSRLGHKP
jgi:hypothetical protein